MDLIRGLLLKLEAIPMKPGSVMVIPPDAEEIAVPDFDADQIEYHLGLIRQAEFVESVGSQPMRGIAFRGLTWAGHDFADSVRDPAIWSKTKKGALAAGGLTAQLLVDLAKGFLKKQIEERTGVKL